MPRCSSPATAGVTLGLIAGHFGGAIDRIITVAIDLLLTVPSLVLAIAIVAAIGANASAWSPRSPSASFPRLARLVRARVLELREQDYVEAARAIGMRHPRILLRHILPNAVSVIVIELSLLAGQAVLVGSALGFLGLGVQPPAPEWGAMLGASREYLRGGAACRVGAGPGGRPAGARLQPVRGRPA